MGEADLKQYYKPWELLPSEEDTIDEQIRQVESRVDRERAELDASRPNGRQSTAERTCEIEPVS